MCGIAGIFNFRSQAPADMRTVERMTGILAHRGPDAEGVYSDRALALGHRRLSILDLSERGRQPMATPDGRYVIVHNGEIYNYVELRRGLGAMGHVFRTDTDTEVLLALYATFGRACVERLNGMFAFAIWDSVTRRLFVARDRIGIKPLYYAETPDGFAFASEAKALFASADVVREPDLRHLHEYMTAGYVSGSNTLFRGVRKLPPGYTLCATDGQMVVRRYWDLDFAPDRHRTADRTADELRALLLDAVRIHLRSDVPVGVFLSGGLDSSTTVALLTEAGCGPIDTFSVAYRHGQQYDETSYARLISQQFGTRHHELYVDPRLFLDFVPRYVWHMDEPVTEAAAISLYFIAKLLRSHVTVALSGEGADELFAGYRIYQYMQWIESYRRVPEWIRSWVVEPQLAGLGGAKVRKYLRLAHEPLEQRYVGVSMDGDGHARALYTDAFGAERPARPAIPWLSTYYDATRGWDPLTRMLYSDLKTWLVDDLLVKADKMTMANAVELRVPFLDHRVVEYAATIPSELKLRHGHAKWILKHAMRERLPRPILRREKVGFPTPLGEMLRREGASYMRDVLLSPRSVSRGYFRRNVVERLIEGHTRGRRQHQDILWKLILLEEWHRQFIDGAPIGRRIDAVVS